jgi:hypothetical protein
VKLLRASKHRVVLQLANREKDLLLTLLRLYPRIPPAHHKLSRSAAAVPDPEGSQRLLDEALAEQRAESQKQLRALIEGPDRLKRIEHGWELALSPTEQEWLLQVLNDIRVGSWLAAGSPADLRDGVSQKTAPHLWAMEAAGAFQMNLLHLLDRAAEH